MCLNCGCQMPDNDMGDSHNITTKNLAATKKANPKMSGDEIIKNMKEGLELIKGEDIDKVSEESNQ